MRRFYLVTALAGSAVLSLAGVFSLDLLADKPGSLVAAPGTRVAQASRTEMAGKLPVSQVVLFNSGVGYFQREGEIDGNCRIDLSFPVQDINDMLKSLVLQDLGGGQVSAVSFDSQAPLQKTLHSFAVDLSSNPTLGQILDQARGEKIEVVLQQSQTSQPGMIAGTIIGIEKQKVPAGKDAAVEVEQLNLWCAEGMRQVKLGDVQRIRFLNPVMESEFRKALEVVTLSHDTQKKAVTLNFAGEGKRSVRVGYVVENPIWKTSYRLVLDKEKKPFLQGWAVVENATDEDWNQVHMALVSGRPISFRMDLYQPLYVPRPVVEPELFASLRPPTYTGPLESTVASGNLPVPPGTVPSREAIKDQEEKVAALSRLRLKGSNIVPDEEVRDESRKLREMKRLAGLDPKQGVTSMATATKLGDSFQYALDQPITLARQKSAMLPLVSKPVEGQRVSIYNERVHARFPLLGLKFKNTTGVNLTQGPITVFDGNNYAGDARILDLQPNEERLLSYSIDLGTEVEAIPHAGNGKLTAVKIQKGIITTTTKLRESKTYTLKNRSEQDRVVLIEHPYRPEFHLTSAEKPTERAEDVYRFRVNVKKGEATKLTVAEERDLQQSVQLTNFDDNAIRVIVNDVASSPAVSKALQAAVEKKLALAQTQQEVANAQRELDAVKQEQPRLRDNLAKIPGTDPLAKRILEKLNRQETQIEEYDEQIKKLNAKADEQRKEYEAYLVGLNIE